MRFFSTGILLFCAICVNAQSLSELYREYMRNPDCSNESACQMRTTELDVALQAQWQSTNAEYRDLVRRKNESELSFHSATTKFRTENPEYRKLGEELASADRIYRRMLMSKTRGNEISIQKNLCTMLKRKQERLEENAPELRSLKKAVRNAERQLRAKHEQLTATSFLAEARELKAAHKLKRSANVFTPIFSDLSGAMDEQTHLARYRSVVTGLLLAEHPGADPEKLRRYVLFLTASDRTLPTDLPLNTDQSADNALDEAFRLLLWSRRTPEDPKIIPAANALSARLPAGSFTRLAHLQQMRRWIDPMRKEYYRSAAAFLRSPNPAKESYSEYFFELLTGENKKKSCNSLMAALGPDRSGVDPWLLLVIQAQQGRDRAWKARGDGFNYTVNRDSWSVFAKELDQAKEYAKRAIAMHPNRLPGYRVLQKAALGSSDGAEQREIFRDIIRLQLDYFPAYSSLSWSMRPRWGGSHELMAQFAEEAMATERYDTSLPSLGFAVLADVARDSDATRWSLCYRRPRVIELGDRLFAAHLTENRPEERSLLLVNRLLFEMASDRYELAKKTLEELGGIDEVRRINPKWRGDSGDRIPRVAVFEDAATRAELFTGPSTSLLRKAEQLAIDGDREEARDMVFQLLKQTDFPVHQQTFLRDLAARWAMTESSENYFRQSAFPVACSNDYPEVVAELLLSGFDYRSSESAPGVIAATIARYGVAPELLDLLAAQGDPLLKHRYGKQQRTLLHLAAWEPNQLMTAKLLQLGFDVRATDTTGHTPLHMALHVCGQETSRILLEAGSDPDSGDSDGDTPIMYACQLNAQPELLELLLKHSKAINKPNNAGRTALHFAVVYNANPTLATRLLNAGADAKLRDKAGKTPLDIAREKKATAYIDLLQSRSGE